MKGFPIYGGVAHLGERLTGSQEVKGSIPFISTTIFDEGSRLLLQLTSFVLHVIL